VQLNTLIYNMRGKYALHVREAPVADPLLLLLPFC
jgi:hypothetical protein